MDVNKPLTNHLPDKQVLFSLIGFYYDQLFLYVRASQLTRNPQKKSSINSPFTFSTADLNRRSLIIITGSYCNPTFIDLKTAV